MTTAGPFVCIVCSVAEAELGLFATCDSCGEYYHYNPRMTPGKDCGDAWIEDEEVGIQFYCNTCMNAARREDQDRLQQLKDLVNSGGATPDTVAALMQSLGPAFAPPAPDSAGNPYAGFPGLAPGMPGAPSLPFGGGFPSTPGGIASPTILDPRDIPPEIMAAAAEDVRHEDGDASHDSEPPRLQPRRSRGASPRRYRRIDE